MKVIRRLGVTAVLLLMLVMGGTASAAEYTHDLQPGQRLYPGDILYSPSHAYRLVMQGDGNLVLYSGGTALWSSGTVGHPGANAVMQGDGNLVVYSGGTALWSSGTANHGGALLDMQDDGNLVIYWNNTAIWSTGTNQPSPPEQAPQPPPGESTPPEPPPAEYTHDLQPGQRLYPGDILYSPSHAYRLVMQGDGNLVVYSGGTALWSSGTVGHPGANAVMQGDGNLVVYGGGTALWSSGTANHGGALLDMQDDGNLVIYWNNKAIWSTGTNASGPGQSPGGHSATPGQRLPAGTVIYSPSHAYRLVMQGDGNLVVYRGSKALWSTGTPHHPGAEGVMQGDGNLVIYWRGKPIWSSGTAHHSGALLDMQDDGNLVIYWSNKAIWSTGTNISGPGRSPGGHSATPGQRLHGGTVIYSPSHRYRLVMQGDGNLVVYRGGKAIWSSGTAHHPGANAVMQGDGNLVIYWRRKAIWSSGTAHHSGALLDMQDDGNLVIYWNNTAIWSSKASSGPPVSPINAAILARTRAIPDGAYGGQCIVWVARILSEASGGRIRLSAYRDGYQGTYRANGARRVSSEAATGGDIIQVTPAGSSDSQGRELDERKPLHTAIILRNLGNGSFSVIDSNEHYHGRILRHGYRPHASGGIVKIWRFH